MKKTLSFLVVSIAVMLATQASAHELRPGVGEAFNLTVGQRVEPAFSGEPNQFDLIVNNLDNTPANVTQIDLRVEMLYLSNESYDARVLHRAQMSGELIRDRQAPNRFNVNYMPTAPGTYGFHFSGTINGVQVDEKYVCGAGSRNPEGRSFGCVQEIQRFPRGHGGREHD